MTETILVAATFANPVSLQGWLVLGLPGNTDQGFLLVTISCTAHAVSFDGVKMPFTDSMRMMIKYHFFNTDLMS